MNSDVNQVAAWALGAEPDDAARVAVDREAQFDWENVTSIVGGLLRIFVESGTGEQK